MPPEETDVITGVIDETSAPSSSATEATPDVTPASSAVDAKEAPRTLLDVVKAVVEPKTGEPEASSATEAEKPESAAATKEDPFSETQYAGQPFSRHPRFTQALKERREALTSASEHQAEVERLKGPADQYASIDRFMQANGLTTNEMVESFKLAALVKNDPEAALNALLPQLVELRKRTGYELPEDIRKDVEEGRITEARGLELSQTKARAARAEQQAQRATTTVETERTTRASEQAIAGIMSATEAWEAKTKASDPDFKAKEEFIADRARAIIQAEGAPASPDAAVAIVARAHKDVTASMKRLMPARPALKRSPEGSPSSNETAAPKTLKEAIAAGAAL